MSTRRDTRDAIRLLVVAILVLLCSLLVGCGGGSGRAQDATERLPAPPTAIEDPHEGEQRGTAEVERDLALARATLAALEAELEETEAAATRERQRRLQLILWAIAGAGFLAVIAGGVLIATGMARKVGFTLAAGGAAAAALGITGAWVVPWISWLAPLLAIATLAAIAWGAWRYRQVAREGFQVGSEAVARLKQLAPDAWSEIRRQAEERQKAKRVHDEVTRLAEAHRVHPDDIPTARTVAR